MRPPVDSPSEIARIRAGDEAAFEALFHAYFAPLCDFAERYVGAPDVAEELVQTLFFDLWTQRAAWAPRGSARAYLFGAVRNRALNHLRHRRVEERWRAASVRAASVREGHLGAAPADAADEIEAAELRTALARAVARLPERARLVVVLRWQHQLRHAEIAEVLGISVKGVENQLARALRALRTHLGGHGR